MASNSKPGTSKRVTLSKSKKFTILRKNWKQRPR